MARQVHRLSARKVKTEWKPGLHADGAGLYLHVSKSGARSWIFRFMLRSVSRDMGLGGLATVSLSDARDLAHNARKLAKAGIDPIKKRDDEAAAQETAAAKNTSFSDCAKALIASHKAGWRNGKHRQQWTSTLETYAFPTLGRLPVDAIDTGLVLKAIEPIWTTKPETASRLRGRIESVLDWAAARDYRSGENPARWRGHLDKLLPARSKVRRVRHHPALPYSELPGFMEALRRQRGISARALEFTILTVARTGETIGAQWAEIDQDNRVWVIPAGRMKAGKEHRVPLSARALSILADIPRQSDYVFPGGKEKKPLSNMALLTTLRRMKRGDITVHGFRSTFRDWCAEQTAYPHEVAEMALAHAVSDKVEAAYRRGDMFEKRRRLMDDWAMCCEQKPAGRVVPLRVRFEKFAKNVVVLRGGMGSRERRAAEEVLRVPEPEERLVLSTGRFLGEGFDDSRLDTLFMVWPISWKGTLAQYVGDCIGSMKARQRCGCTTT